MSAPIEVTANKAGRSLTVSYDFGSSIQEMIEKFGEQVVMTNAVQAMKISLQARIRAAFDKGLDDQTIAADCASWKPGVQSQRTSDPVAAILSKWSTLDPEAKAEMLKKLKQSV